MSRPPDDELRRGAVSAGRSSSTAAPRFDSPAHLEYIIRASVHGRENIGRQGTWLTAGMSTDEAQRVLDRLKGRGPLSLRKPSRAWDKSLTNKIADLRLHPAVESGLHLLNDDIVSAHFVPSCHCLIYNR